MGVSVIKKQESEIAPPPILFVGMLTSIWQSKCLQTALALGIFDNLDAPKSATHLAKAVHVAERPLQRLLKTLVSMNVLQEVADEYALTDLARAYLCSDSDLSLGHFMRGLDNMSSAMDSLTRSIQDGKPAISCNDEPVAETFFPELVKAIFPLSYPTAKAAAEVLVKKLPTHAKVLDVGTGSGVWSIPLAEQNPQVTIYAQDYQAILDVAHQFAAQYGVEKCYRDLPGAWQNTDFPRDCDAIILGHVCDGQGQTDSLKLMKKCLEALKPGGHLIIPCFLSNESHTAPEFESVFDLYLYVLTEDGRVFSKSEMFQMMQESGFEQIALLDMPAYAQYPFILIAEKPGS